MVLVFDVDGVLADFILGFTTVAHKLFGTPIYGTNQQAKWDDFVDMDSKMVSDTWEEIKRDPLFWLRLVPLIDQKTFDRINRPSMNSDIYFVTSRVGIYCKLQTEKWLEYNGVSSPTVIISSNKGEICKAVKATAMIDDKAGNAVFTQYHSKDTIPFLLDRPYNQFDESVLGSKVKRIKTVDQFLNLTIDPLVGG